MCNLQARIIYMDGSDFVLGSIKISENLIIIENLIYSIWQLVSTYGLVESDYIFV